MSVESEPYPLPREPAWTHPTRLSALSFAAKVNAFRARRAVVDVVAGPRRLSRAGVRGDQVI